MKIKINKKTYKIKPATELTISEYIKVFDGLTSDVNDFELLMRYISITTGIDINEAAKVNIDADDIRRLISYIGKIPMANEIPAVEEFFYKRSGKRLYKGNLDWQTLGVRGMLENRNAETQTEQAVYLLAVLISENYDAEKVEKIYNDLLNYNALEVLGFVIFFFKSLYSGKPKETNFLKKLLEKANINILK